MMSVYIQKKTKKVLLALFALMFCAVSFLCFPMSIARAETDSLDDYEEFYQSFMEMKREYDYSEDDGISVSRTVDDDYDPGYDTRLIVTTESKDIDDYGAVASCHYKNHYYFQYEDYYDTDMAYEYFAGLDNVEVMYDYRTCLNGDTIEVNATSYNSWGWNAQTDYLGANAYLTTLMETVETSNLNGQVVAVIDTGINPNHTLFSGRILTKYAKNYCSNENNWYDTAGHGTHVAGTIAEITPDSVKILPIRVLDTNGRGVVSDITAAIDYLVRSKSVIESYSGCQFKLMNMSLGVTSDAAAVREEIAGSVSANAISYFNLEGWVEEAYSKGILTIASAGNTETGGRLISSAPANIPHAITVSALARTLVSSAPLMYDYSYSDYGPTVDFAAPGTLISSAGISGATSTRTMSGTSMAAPHVTACVALVYLNPHYKNLSFEDLNTLLQENANRSMIYQNKHALTSNQIKNNYYGYGIINIKNIGMVIEGSVNFSVGSNQSDTAINVKLSASTSVGAGQTLEIYYTTDENADMVSSTTGTLYNNSIGINVANSTRILAAAFVKQNGVIAKRSEVCEKVYYIANQDLQSRYRLSNGNIVQYLGNELTTLIVPSEIGGVRVTGVNNKAFNDSPVQKLLLPSSISSINANAFDSNTKLREIECDSASVDIGNYAFQKCTNLSVVNIPNIKTLGQLAFAYSTSINKMNLMRVQSIGKNAFSASGLQTIVIGKNVMSIGAHTQMSLKEVYGYGGTAAENFADANDADFYDLTLRIFEDLPNQKVIREGDSTKFRVICAGYGVTPSVSGAGNFAQVQTTGDYSRTVVEVTVSGLRTGNYDIVINLKDYYGETVSSNVMKMVVVPKSTESYTLSYNNDEYDLYVDGELVSSNVKLFKGQNYSITYAAHKGYNINKIVINGQTMSTNPLRYDIQGANGDVVISINTVEKDRLDVNFISEHGDIYINGSLLQDSFPSVDRGETLRFTVSSDEGWIVRKVLVDGREVSATGGVYTISNITSKKVVEVKYEEANYSIEISFVNSCGSFIVNGGDATGGVISNVAHGSSRVITISANEGFAIDFVSINGNVIEVTGGKVTVVNIDEIDSDKEVIVSFKSQKISIFKRDNSTILYYFIVLLALFVLFIVGIVVMKIVRKYKKQD